MQPYPAAPHDAATVTAREATSASSPGTRGSARFVRRAPHHRAVAHPAAVSDHDHRAHRQEPPVEAGRRSIRGLAQAREQPPRQVRARGGRQLVRHRLLVSAHGAEQRIPRTPGLIRHPSTRGDRPRARTSTRPAPVASEAQPHRSERGPHRPLCALPLLTTRSRRLHRHIRDGSPRPLRDGNSRAQHRRQRPTGNHFHRPHPLLGPNGLPLSRPDRRSNVKR